MAVRADSERDRAVFSSSPFSFAGNSYKRCKYVGVGNAHIFFAYKGGKRAIAALELLNGGMQNL